MVLRSRAAGHPRLVGVAFPPPCGEMNERMKWTRTAFKHPSQHYSACIYNDDHVLSGWVVIWVDKYRQFDCLPHTVLVSSCWSCPTLLRCRATVFYISECSCVFYCPLFPDYDHHYWSGFGPLMDQLLTRPMSILTDSDSDGTSLSDF